jgi:hypothetical protein
MTTFKKWTDLLSQRLGEEVYFEETSMEEWAKEATVVPGVGQELAEMWNYVGTIGYFGGDAVAIRRITEVWQRPTNPRDQNSNGYS